MPGARRTRLREAALVAPVAVMLACTASRPAEVSPEPEPLAAYLKEHHIRDLRVTADTGPATWLHDPQVIGDSLVGDAGRDNPPARRAILLSNVRKLEVSSMNAGRTIGLMVMVVGVATIALLVVASRALSQIE